MSDKVTFAYPSEIPKDYTPDADAPWYKGSGKLEGMVAILTGADSGIGRSVGILYAREGADVCIVYHSSDDDAEEAKKLVEKEGRQCLLLKKDLSRKKDCEEVVQETVDKFGHLDILVNNAAMQNPKDDLLEIDEDQLDKTFRTNIYSMFFMTQAALPHLMKSKNPSIINSTSINAWRGHSSLIDYTSTKGAIVGFTRSMAQNLAKKGVRVNMVAPGPIWTALIPETFSEERMEGFGQDTPMGRAGQPEELAPSYVFYASRESSYITGQTMHVNGGTSF